MLARSVCAGRWKRLNRWVGTGRRQHLEQVEDVIRVQPVVTEPVQDLYPRAQGQVLETGFSQRVGLPFLQLPAVVDDVLEVAVEGLGPGTPAPAQKHVTTEHAVGGGAQGLAKGQGARRNHRRDCQPLAAWPCRTTCRDLTLSDPKQGGHMRSFSQNRLCDLKPGTAHAGETGPCLVSWHTCPQLSANTKHHGPHFERSFSVGNI